MQAKVLSPKEILLKLKQNKKEYQSNYLAMFSTWYGGIVREPWMMMVPIDDHMVHRGDGIFEAMKITNRGIYLLDEHLDRLYYSGRRIGLMPPMSERDLRKAVIETAKAAKVSEGIIRLFLGRGVGSFSPNPYDPEKSELYVVVTKSSKPSSRKYKEGVSICRSSIPAKPGFFPQVKSLNYLPNVLMKKEAIDRGFDFAIGMDAQNHLLEGATENLILVTKENELVHPPLDKILKGTMMDRLFELIENDSLLKLKRGVKISEKDISGSRGVFLVGTSLDIISVSRYEETPIRVSTLGKKFLKLLIEDQKPGSSKMTMLD